MDLSDLIDRNAAFAPDKPAIRFMGSTLSYAGLAERIAATARALKSQAGIGRGDRVAILAANHPDCLVLLYACARLGAMLVPLNWRLAVPEQIYILSDASVKALVVEQALARVVAPLKSARSRRAHPRARFHARRRARRWPTSCKPRAARGAFRTSILRVRCSSFTPPGPPAIRRVRCCARMRSCGTRS